ncbi:ScyD/ScyE family protein [Gramella sp. KN1008]|uniref:ScyD/ScyE family protein n=1 Tax=Gramella sp. KN1008 TaxID=2529298 RepID=UPI00103876A4|nr:ScyD/ScyE family protein [Gramella sp. KN1008]TBW29940.1 ScyD/ScyE family protein [Gramella sp. KN1008]
MKNYSVLGLLCLIGIFITGCSNESVPTAIPAQEESSLMNPASLKANHNGDGGFTGFIFDLATAPNNEILVADAGAGISTRHGEILFSLEGASSVAPVGTGVMWVTTWPWFGAPTEDSGQGIHLVTKGRTKMVANLFEFESENNPDGEEELDSNPYAVYAHNASFAVVADAGANDLLKVHNNGNIELMAIFPPEMVSTENLKNLVGCPDSGAGPCGLPDMIPAQAVPTSVTLGPDGYYYVGELKGFPAPTGESNIWRISPGASGAMCGSSPDCMKAFDGGFTSIIDLTFDENGMLYVAELDEQSWFAVEFLDSFAGGNIKACDPETMQCEVIATGIPMLTAITFDKDGRLWATQNSLIPGLSEVIEISL